MYGKGTFGALSAYNKKYLGGADLKKSDNAVKSINTVSSLNTSPAPKAAPTPSSKSVPTTQPDDTFKVASGTGFYVSENGHIITNHHVIEGCKDMKVHAKGEILRTVKIAEDELNDLALLKISEPTSHIFALSDENPYLLKNIIVAG